VAADNTRFFTYVVRIHLRKKTFITKYPGTLPRSERAFRRRTHPERSPYPPRLGFHRGASWTAPTPPEIAGRQIDNG
jgi:hypothetical protein